MRIEDLKQMKVKLLGHFPSTLVLRILVKPIYFCFSPSVIIVATKKKHIFWVLFVSSTGLLEAFKETTEGAKFFKEETCKGRVFCVCMLILCVALFSCLDFFFLLAL